MELTHVVAIRHGETAWNAEARIQGQLDIPLNERGLAQAQALAAALADQPLAAVYASDLRRAHQTARAFAVPAGLEVRTDVRLRERAFGRFEGFTFTEIEARWPEDSLRWRRREPDFEVGGGESLRQFERRCVAVCEELAARHLGESIAIVAHGGVLDMLYRAAARIELHSPRTWELGNAGLNRLIYSPEGFAIVGWNDRSHLEGL